MTFDRKGVSMSAIGSISSGASAQQSQQVGVAVAGKVQDAAKAQGEAVTELLEVAAGVAKQQPGKGTKIDVHG